jgi:hypothetical protein
MRKGGGLLKKTLNFFTRRKKPLRSPVLSNEEIRQKNTLKKQKEKTEKNKKNLTRLTAKLAPPEAKYQEELEARSRFQKFFNRFYKQADQEVLTPKELLRIPVEGIVEVYKNSRKPFNKQRARIPNKNLRDPNIFDLDESKTVNGRKIPLASQIIVEYLTIPKLYAMWKQEPPKPSLEDIPEEEFQEFSDLIRQKLDADEDFDAIARDVFHVEGGEAAMKQWIQENEEGFGYEQGDYKVANYNAPLLNGSRHTIQVIMTPGAIQFGRYLSRITSGKKKILKVREAGDHTCQGPAPENSGDSYVPLTSLKSNGCFTLFNGNMFEVIGMNMTPNGNNVPEGGPKYYTPAMLTKNWIILKKDYFPIKNAPLLPLMAKYFPTATYIQEALDNWGIEGIDAFFLELLQMKYPQYAIKFTTYMFNTGDFSYQRQKLRSFENYLLLDKTIFPDVVGFTALNPFEETSKMYTYIEEAVTSEKLYGMSPYMAYAMKKLNLPFWKKAFRSEAAKRNLEVYEGLSEQEKITVDYLQHLNFEEHLKDSGYDFAQARDTYNRELGSGTTREGVIEETLSNYLEEGFDKHKKQLLFYQSIVTKTYAGERVEPKVMRNDILHLLTKFVARDSSGLGAGAPPPFNGPRLNLTALGGPAEFEEPKPAVVAVNEPKPRQITWGNENENANLPPLRRINLSQRNGFGANRNAMLNKTRKRKAELETYLEKATRVYNSFAPRLQELEARSRFLTAKKRYNRLSNAELKNLRNYQTIQEYSMAKQIAERELKHLNSILSRR